MSIKALSEYTRIAKYARYIPEKKRRESWNEQVDRVFDMHKIKFAAVLDQLLPFLEEARTAMKNKIVLGSQRALQFGGQAILDKESKIFNCTASHINRARVFQETMFLLLCGCGVGFSVQKHHVAQLPRIIPRGTEKIHLLIQDTIEGWADAIGALMSSYFEDPVVGFEGYQGKIIEFDFSAIRPLGAIIKSSGHKAPGPDGLRKSLEKIGTLLERQIRAGCDRLRPIDAYDIIMHSSDAVLSGGVRRSATICLFSKDDDEMMKAKTGDWFYSNPQRGRSNNSVVLLRESTTREEWGQIMHSVREFGEPGFLFVDDLDALTNPCAEIGLDAHDEKGNPGFAFCNLTEINGKKCKTEEDFLYACRVSAILGTMQAAYTQIDYLFDAKYGYNVTEKILKDEALLGCSITGIQDQPHILLNPEIQIRGAQLIKKINEQIAEIIGIRTASRTTTVKPAGTTSLLLGTASGIHPHHSRRYFRRVQANIMEEPLKFFKMFNPLAVNKSVWSNNGTDECITFLCEVPEGARVKNEHSAIDLLKDVMNTQQNWIQAGNRPERSRIKNITHNVSNTINVKDEEWPKVEAFIYNNRQWFSGVSILSMSGDMDYPQAPFQAVHTPREIVKEYGDGSLMASGLIVDGMKEFEDNLWLACDVVNGFGIQEDQLTPLQKDWKRRAIKFARNYFNGDIRKMSYCLKEVHSWKQWCDLTREYMDVPWDQMFEENFEAKNAADDAATACSGGACEVKSL